MTHLMLTAASVFVSLGTGVQTNTVTQDGFLSGDAASIAVKLLEGAGGGADRWSSPLTVHKHHGEFYVAVPPGREFGIALKSNGWTRYEFVIEVDGVNVASGRRTTGHEQGYLVDRGENNNRVIPGFRHGTGNAVRFRLSETNDERVEPLTRQGGMGQIHIRVYEEQENAGLRMPVVPGGRFGRGGLGAEPRRHAREKPFKRGAMLEEFYLKYGTPEDLRRAGITPGS